jgi:hypothetical protein
VRRGRVKEGFGSFVFGRWSFANRRWPMAANGVKAKTNPKDQRPILTNNRLYGIHLKLTAPAQ